MTTPLRPSPGLDAASLLADVQRQALRGMVWAILAFCPVELYFFHARPLAERSGTSLAFEAVLLAGVAAQYFSLNRLSVRGSGLLFVTWLGIIDVLAWLTMGPQMGTGIALVCTTLTALFFINKRAGAAVVVGFGVLVVVQALLVEHGVLAPYSPVAVRGPATTAALLRAGLNNFAVLAVGYACFATIHHALFRVLAQAEEERKSRAAAEATMRANQHFEALGKLTSGVAHDVNNALTSVLGNAELLKMSLPAGEQQTFADDVISAARAAAQTTRHLLSLNRHSFCQPVSLDPAQTAASVTRLVGRLMPDNIRLALEVRSTRRILVDPADLQQALLNLLLNARDALPAGGAVTLRTEDGPGPGVTLTVTDNGSGVPAEVLPRIFDPFFTTKGEGKGTGLGLAMVSAFVEEAGGTVAAENNPSRGATFRLTFPACPLPAETAADESAAPPDMPGRHILLIEDQAELRSLMDRVLTRGGHRVTTAGSAAEAVKLLGTQDFDLLCTDGIFGSLPVSVVIAEYRRQRPDAPVLLCSGHADQELLGGGIASLRADLLRKPFTGTELLARVRRTLRQAAAGRPA
jgi:signal transduction histidine kinase/CheY-like chemotaxis protein